MDGPLYDRFVRFREVVTTGLGAHGEQALRLYPPKQGQRVLDVGCGFGDTTQRIAAIVGPQGEAVGVDAAARFIEDAVRESAQAGAENARFLVADVERTLEGERDFDVAFSRFGTMFFANPVAAMRNVRARARARRRPGDGRVAPARGQRLALPRADDRRGDRATTRGVRRAHVRAGPVLDGRRGHDERVLINAGFADVALARCDTPILVGRDLEEALEMVMALGPAGEILRLAGDRAAHLHGEVEAALRAGLADFRLRGRRPSGAGLELDRDRAGSRLSAGRVQLAAEQVRSAYRPACVRRR